MMTTTTKDLTQDRRDPRFEDRLLDALLAEFDAPAEVRESPGPMPSVGWGRRPARQRAGALLAAAAVVALLAGSTWVFTGGLDPDDAQVTVAGSPTTVGEPLYLLFPEAASPPGASISFQPTPNYFGDQRPSAAWFRPRSGGLTRPLVGFIVDPARRTAGSGSTSRTPGGIAVTVPDGLDGPSGSVEFGSWIDADGRVVTVRQATSSALSAQTLDRLSTADVLALVDAVRIGADGSIALADPAYEPADDDPNRSLEPADYWTTSSSKSDEAGRSTVFLQLSGVAGAADLALVPGDRVTVRGATGVVGASSAFDVVTSLVWVEDNTTLTLSYSGPGDERPGPADLIAAAESLQRVSRAEFDARLGVQPVAGGLRLDLPVEVSDWPVLHVRSLGLDGEPLFGDQVVFDAAYAVDGQRYVDVIVPRDAATILVWSSLDGSSDVVPACAQRIDVASITPEMPMRVTLEPGCQRSTR